MGPLDCRYIVEEGRRERAGGGGERKQKRDAGEPFLFFVCVFWFVEKESLHLPTIPGSRDTPTSEGTFSTWFFLCCYHYLLGVFWELAIYLFQTYTGRKKAFSSFKSFCTPCQG